MSDIIFLQSERLILRPLSRTDLGPVYQQWLNDEDVTRFNSHGTFPNTEEKMEAYFKSISNNDKAVVLAIIEKTSSVHVGNIALQQINWVSRNAEFAILLGDKQWWGKGIGEEAALLLLNYAFERLNLHRVYCGTINGNEGMKKLALKMGMKSEGVRRDAIFKNGAYHDILEYGVLKNEFVDAVKK